MNLSEVRTNYDRAAKYYDALTDLVFDWILGLEKYREQTIDTLGELRGATVVDVGCGTGRSFSSIPDSGFLRWLYPIYSFALRHAGIDTAEDLDNAKLQAKWERGRDVMRARLTDLREETYLQGTGIILSGRKPEGRAKSEGGSSDGARGGNTRGVPG